MRGTVTCLVVAALAVALGLFIKAVADVPQNRCEWAYLERATRSRCTNPDTYSSCQEWAYSRPQWGLAEAACSK